MSFDFAPFRRQTSPGAERLDESYVDWLVHDWAIEQEQRYGRLYDYYHNELQPLSLRHTETDAHSRGYRQAQEAGLPRRITGAQPQTTTETTDHIQRKEVVIENDIAWRIDTIVDFLFGKPFQVMARHDNPQRAAEMNRIIETVFQANGGASFFQSLALLGSLYGFVDIILRWDELGQRNNGGLQESAAAGGNEPQASGHICARAQRIILEVIEAPRCLPILNTRHYEQIDYYIQQYRLAHPHLDSGNDWLHMEDRADRPVAHQQQTHEVEIISPNWYQRYRDRQLLAEGPNPLGAVPVVHIQNMPLPHQYEGQGDVLPLIPLQDELNARLSDRANRITMQSFKMYLGRGIDGFIDRPVGPGQMWSTLNTQAAIDEFGGDSECPSETGHIEQVREALEKASGVASVAAGILKGRVGNLTSAVALKITLMGVLAKTERKRQSYGRGIRQLCQLIMLALDRSGLYPNRPDERQFDILWPDPLPENKLEKLQEAALKLQMGLDRELVIKELGY